MYLVPATLGCILALAAVRGDLRAMWDGGEDRHGGAPGDEEVGEAPCGGDERASLLA